MYIIQDTDCEQEYDPDSMGLPEKVQAGPCLPMIHCVKVLPSFKKLILNAYGSCIFYY